MEWYFYVIFVLSSWAMSFISYRMGVREGSVDKDKSYMYILSNIVDLLNKKGNSLFTFNEKEQRIIYKSLTDCSNSILYGDDYRKELIELRNRFEKK